MLIGGECTRQFKARLAALARVPDVQLFSSGRAALRAALLALNLPKGAAVAVPTYACKAVAWSIEAAGLELALCDITPEWQLSPDAVAAAVGKGCRAILLAPPFGLLQSAAPFRRYGLPVIHDLCQASPAALAKADRASLGDIAVMSFHPTKYSCASGGGAAFDLNGRYSPALTETEHNLSEIAPLTAMQSAMGLVQLDRLEEFGLRRRAIFQRYAAALSESDWRPLKRALDVPVDNLLRVPVRVEAGQLDHYFAQFAALGVTARQGVDNLIHGDMELPDTEFPNACAAFENTLSIPFHPSLSDDEVNRVAGALTAILGAR